MSKYEQTRLNFIDLNETSGFNKTLEYFNENKDRNWNDWLEIQKFFKSGVQGIVGLFNCNDNDHKFVFKIPKKIDFLTKHEFTIMKGINTIANFCPHFCRGFGEVVFQVNPKIKKNNVFTKSDDTIPINKEVLFMEYIDKADRFSKLIKNTEDYDDDIIYSCIKQVLGAILVSQNSNKFTHYDLFYSNIMVRKCSKDLVMLYITDDETYFAVPTLGYTPIIIDYGFSYIGNMNGDYLWQNMGHTNAGFYSDRFNEIADLKHFLVSIAEDIKRCRDKSKKNKKFCNVVKNLFRDFDVDWEQGWTNEHEEAACDEVDNILLKIIDIHKLDSKIFIPGYSGYCIDLIQTLIVLPLEKQDISAVAPAFCDFLEEFIKIENEIDSEYYILYILKNIVNIARRIRKDFRKDNEIRKMAVNYFKTELAVIVKSISPSSNIDDVDCEKLLKGLYKFSICIEGIMYYNMQEQMRNFEENREKLEIQKPEEMALVVDINTEDSYEFNENTEIMVVDSRVKKCATFKLLKSEIEELNQLDVLSRSTELFKIYQL